MTVRSNSLIQPSALTTAGTAIASYVVPANTRALVKDVRVIAIAAATVYLDHLPASGGGGAINSYVVATAGSVADKSSFVVLRSGDTLRLRCTGSGGSVIAAAYGAELSTL